MEKNFQKNLTFQITEYAYCIFQNLRSLYSLEQDMFRDSLLPFNNTRTLTKSFEKTSAKGGKPLIKTHNKRFLIKEVKKEEKDFFMQILPKYHLHLRKNAKTLLAKIVGIYSIKIGNKDKVYQILMESLDPVDESFIKFKYDLKFSSVNRREFKRKQEVKVVQEELLKQTDKLIGELFPATKPSINSLKRLDDPKNLVPSASSDSKSKEGKRSGGKRRSKGGGTSSDTTNDQKTQSKSKEKSKSSSNEQGDSDEDEDEDDMDDRDNYADDEFQDIENDEKFKLMDYDEQLIYREQQNLYKQQRQWTKDQKINVKDNPQLKAQLMAKLGLLKDSDFKQMHDRKLPVCAENGDSVSEFVQTIEKDVRFLESLRIMDYSLFLIILQVPKSENENGSVSYHIHCKEMDMEGKNKQANNNHQNSELSDSVLNQKQKEEDLFCTLDGLISQNHFVMSSPTHNFVYLMGLIDYLGKWNIQKRSEMYGKTFLAHFIR